MRPGRIPKPTALKRLEGNPGKRSLPTNEVQPLALMPACPEWLSPAAEDHWAAIAPVLLRLGLLTEVDGVALAAYCSAVALWQRAQRVLDEEGLTVASPSGYLMQRPEVSIVAKYLAIMRGFGNEFGLTPSSRSRLGATLPPDPEAGIADLLD